MSNRHLGRTLALQTLFEWDFHEGKRDVGSCLEHVKENFAPEYDDQGFTKELSEGVIEKLEELNGLITRFAPDWPLAQINIVDRNALRIGIYELKYTTLPHKVVINEAIELAKAYGGGASGRFVNGVLGSVFRELEAKGELPVREPEPELPVSQTAVGGVIVRPVENGLMVVLVKDGIGRWTFPKGKVEGEMELLAAARHEITDETGLTEFDVRDQVGEIEVTVNEPGKEPVRKRVIYFLMTTAQTELTIKTSPGLQGGEWFALSAAREAISYENAREILDKAMTALRSTEFASLLPNS